MSKYLNYDAKLERLNQADRTFICKYRQFEEKIRHQERSIFDASLTDHLQNIKRKPISVKNETAQVNEVLAYHDWVCESKKLQRRNNGSANNETSLPQILVSYEDLFNYCKMRVEGLGMKVWSQSKLCTAILRMLLFIEAKMHINDELEAAIMEMRDNTRALLAKAKREADRLVKTRPSVDELREQGKLLSFIELVKVCQKQEWRVEVLVKNFKRTKQMQQVIGKMLPDETLRLAVISTLLKVPLRKGEFEACTVDMTTMPWRLKLSADDRKSGQPINNSLSRKEMEMFQFLLKAKRARDKDGSVKMTWRPFEGRNTTEILKATTRDIAGVSMTIMDLRTAAESYVDLVGREDVQNALSFAEGHTERVAKQYYKRNGSTTVMRPWIDHIEGLIHGGNSNDNNNLNSKLDEEIDKRMELSQQEWRKKIEKEVRDLADQKGTPIIKRKVREDWSEEEDAELRRLVRLYGKGRWKDILESSQLLQKRYQTAPTVQRARECLKTRWRVLARCQDGTGNGSGVKRLADGKVFVDIHRRKKRRVVDKPTSKLRSTSRRSNEVFAYSEQLDESKGWESIASGDGDGNMPHEDYLLPHNEADGDPRLSMKKRKSWDYRYKELLEFRDKYGHCDVPQKVSPLGKFVANQREYYKAFVQGQSSALTEEKVDLLNSIDFTWRVEKSRPRQCSGSGLSR